MEFGHICTAMVTPFDARGNIDKEKTKHLIDYLIANGSDSLVIAGTTGESPTLSTKEKLEFFQFVTNYVNNRVAVIAGTGSNNTLASTNLTKKATSLGVDGIMVVAPYYNKPSQSGMIAHMKEVAASTTLPVMLYNVPGRTMVNMTAETVVELSKVPNIVALKEASGDLEQMATIIQKTADDFYVYSGDDSLTLPSMAIGSCGVVSVASHIIGKEMQEMIQLFLKGDVKKAAATHRQLLPLMKGVFLAPNPTCVKYALSVLKGIDVGEVRMPLLPLTTSEKKQIEQIMYHI
ncbi:4-hydroxy-tetrahydrodipicolinate synthase [Bacillus solitudinis]|uniref:4-hydroxy-tetrahydrodipicolinate synthase n=1 Tax=Bacillus solitudinis TaxID=2014074 RepID=UPI000C232A72|nr:4-hydroxy-tetrahydrodipicolinate synthase [Bacillus solitudinis]